MEFGFLATPRFLNPFPPHEVVSVKLRLRTCRNLFSQRDEIGELYDNAEVYFKEHAGDLCKPGTKQGETKLAFFGVKIGMPTVIKTIRHSGLPSTYYATIPFKVNIRPVK